jgi:hypothetical protein
MAVSVQTDLPLILWLMEVPVRGTAVEDGIRLLSAARVQHACVGPGSTLPFLVHAPFLRAPASAGGGLRGGCWLSLGGVVKGDGEGTLMDRVHKATILHPCDAPSRVAPRWQQPSPLQDAPGELQLFRLPYSEEGDQTTRGVPVEASSDCVCLPPRRTRGMTAAHSAAHAV